MSVPLEALLAGLDWEPVKPPDGELPVGADGRPLPYITHRAVVAIQGVELELLQLSNDLKIIAAGSSGAAQRLLDAGALRYGP